MTGISLQVQSLALAESFPSWHCHDALALNIADGLQSRPRERILQEKGRGGGGGHRNVLSPALIEPRWWNPTWTRARPRGHEAAQSANHIAPLIAEWRPWRAQCLMESYQVARLVNSIYAWDYFYKRMSTPQAFTVNIPKARIWFGVGDWLVEWFGWVVVLAGSWTDKE